MFKVGDKVVVSVNETEEYRLQILRQLPEIKLQGYAVITDIVDGIAYFHEGHNIGWFSHRFQPFSGKVKKINYRKWAKDNKVYNYSRIPLEKLKDAYPDVEKLPEGKHVKWFLKSLKTLDNWALRDEGGIIRRYLSKACLWDMRNIPDCTQYVYGVSLGDHPRYEEWLRYHIQESPFAHVFKTKDPKQAIKKGLELDVNANFSHCVAAMTNVRQGWEHLGIVNMFFHLIELGAKKNTAFVFAHYLNMRGGKYEVYPNSAHTAFCGGMSTKDLASFANKGKLLTPTTSLLKDGGSEYKVNLSIANPDGGKNLEKDFPGVIAKGWDAVKTLTKEQLVEFIKTFESM